MNVLRTIIPGARTSLVVSFVALGACALGACASQERGPASAKSPDSTGGGPQAVANDRAACDDICSASAACGDEPKECLTRCQEWLVKRSRPGIASATAKCAVPRIDLACEEDAEKGAARALVMCVDQAGREELRGDKKALLTAARAICERGARCNGGDAGDAKLCVDKITASEPAPKGLGIFGAIRPEHVQQFASCMQTTECGPAAAVCFGEMLGEDVEEPDSAPAADEPPVDTEAPGTTKIRF